MNFDLNINNYSKKELMEMLGLSPNFGQEEFDVKETQLKDNIVGNFELDKETQDKTIQFIKQIRGLLFDGTVKKDIAKFVAPYSDGL